MKNKLTVVIPVFTASILISLSNANFQNLGFADAAEFALAAKIGGIAHPPGFPAWIILSAVWLKILSFTGMNTVSSLVIFSGVCSAAAASVMGLCSRLLTSSLYPELKTTTHTVIAIVTGITLATGTTVWHWSHSVEVYSLQLFAFCLLVYGILRLMQKPDLRSVLCIAGGTAIGLANHHLTMILFLPFAAFLVLKGWRTIQGVKNKKAIRVSSHTIPAFRIKQIILYTAGLTFLMYLWIIIRASAPLPFAFGQPDTLNRFFYHLSGGAWIKNTQQQVEGLAGMRFPYFMRLTVEQLGLLIPFIIAGIIYLRKKGAANSAWSFLLYYIILLFYQLRIDQTADTDAYMITAYAGLTLLSAVAMAQWIGKKQGAVYAYFGIPVVHLLLFFNATDLRKFDLSTSILNQLDEAAPQNSVILIADWTSMINYTHARIDQDFRKDLTVLNYDLKFTHKDIFPRNYPEAYAYAKKEYDHFITLLGEQHPQEIYNTGCTLDSPELTSAYLSTVDKLKEYARSKNAAFMADPKAFIFLSQNGIFRQSTVSGGLVSNIPTGRKTSIADLSRQGWLSVPHIRMDAAASDKLVDLEAALDFHRNEYKQTGKTADFQAVDSAYQEVKKIQRELKRNMPFLFRVN